LTTVAVVLLLISAGLSQGQRQTANDASSTGRVGGNGLPSATSSNDCRGSADRFRSLNLPVTYVIPLEKIGGTYIGIVGLREKYFFICEVFVTGE
jgi:hypothetical protein